jgi:hypothetical protein
LLTNSREASLFAEVDCFGLLLAMKFRTAVSSSKEVLFVGHEHGNSRRPEEWVSETGRWKIDVAAFDQIVNAALDGHSFGTSIKYFIFGFDIGELDAYGDWFRATADYTSYRPKKKELLSVGQIHWLTIKDRSPEEQLDAFRRAVNSAILRAGKKQRKPKDFDCVGFASAVDAVVATISPESVTAHPAL